MEEKDRGRSNIMGGKSIRRNVYKYQPPFKIEYGESLNKLANEYSKLEEMRDIPNIHQKQNRKRILKCTRSEWEEDEQAIHELSEYTVNSNLHHKMGCRCKQCRMFHMIKTDFQPKKRPKDEDKWMKLKYPKKENYGQRGKTFETIKIRKNENHYESEIITGRYPYVEFDIKKLRRGLEMPLTMRGNNRKISYLKGRNICGSPDYWDPRGKGYYKEYSKDMKAEKQFWKYSLKV